MDLSEVTLEEIAESLSTSEIQVLQYLKGDKHLKGAREKIESQALSTEDIISQYTRLQYVEQEIEIMAGLKATFRTLPPACMDEALTFAEEESDGKNEKFNRILSRRRLSYALIDVNGEAIGPMPVEGSYLDHIRQGKEDFEQALLDYANAVYDALSYYGLADKLAEAFGVWESVIWNRINGIDDLSVNLKNSTRGPEKEQ